MPFHSPETRSLNPDSRTPVKNGSDGRLQGFNNSSLTDVLQIASVTFPEATCWQLSAWCMEVESGDIRYVDVRGVVRDRQPTSAQRTHDLRNRMR